MGDRSTPPDLSMAPTVWIKFGKATGAPLDCSWDSPDPDDEQFYNYVVYAPTSEDALPESWAHCARCGGMLADYPTGDMRCRGCEAEAERDRLRSTLGELLIYARGNAVVLAKIHAALDPTARANGGQS
jgi:hypothetical protein